MDTPERLLMRFNTRCLLCLLLPLFLSLAACKKHKSQIDAPSIAVKLEKVKLKELTRPIIVPATTSPFARSQLSFQVAGVVKKVQIEEGESVKQGQILATLDKASTKLNVALSKAKYNEAITTYRKFKKGYRKEIVKQHYASYKQSLALFNRAKQDFYRVRNLYKKRVVSKQSYTNALSSYQSALAQKNRAWQMYKMYSKGYDKADIQVAGVRFSQARTQLKLAKKQLSDTELHAPFSGVISKKSIGVGELVSPGRGAFELLDISRIKVQVGVPERLIDDLHRGQTAKVFFAPGKLAGEGVISHKGVALDKATLTYPVELIVSNKILRGGKRFPVYKILPGKVVIVHFWRQKRYKGVALPLQAVLHDGQKKFVFINDKKRAKKVEVKTKGTFKNRIVVEGLSDGVEVVVAGQHQLSNNRRLFVIDTVKQ